MKHYAICELKNGTYECIYVLPRNVDIKYKEMVINVIDQLKRDNETRKEEYKIIKFVDLVEHGNGFSVFDHYKWCEQRCEEAKTATFPIYDFKHPENGIQI